MRTAGKLTALEVARAGRKRAKGKLGDGGGLWLVNGSAWVFRYRRDGREHFMGLGPADAVSLAEAREAAREARRLLARGVDPVGERRAARADAKTPTFAAFAKEHIAAHKAGWSPEHATRWSQSLANDAYPPFRDIHLRAAECY
jgi:Arm DNA-binding domain